MSLRPFAALALLVCTSMPAEAQLLGTPAASTPALPNQCRIIENRAADTRGDGVLVAECQTREGQQASAIHPAECTSAISLRNGVLACTGTVTLEGPFRAGGAENRIVDELLASVLGGARQPSTDTGWSQGFLPTSARRTMPETRISQALAARTLTAANAATLRNEHRQLIALDTRHATDGRYTRDEYAELQDAGNALNRRIDSLIDTRAPASGWQPLTERRAEFDNRRLQAIDAGVITSAASAQLRTDWQALERQEADFARDGLDAREIGILQGRQNEIERRLGRFGKPSAGSDSASNAPISVRGAQDWQALADSIRTAEGNRSLNRMQAERLRTEVEDLRRLDDAWRRLTRNRLTAEQQGYLDRRHADISTRLGQMLKRS